METIFDSTLLAQMTIHVYGV